MARLTPYLALSLLALAGCATAATSPTPATAPLPRLTLTSPAFAPGAAIPKQYTCQGADSSPALAWTPGPQGTQTYALIMDDPDAPGGTWVHWVIYNLPATALALPEGASSSKVPAANLPAGAAQGQTSFNRAGYGGPCPPSGTHRYFFHLYALDITLAHTALDKAALLKAMTGHILAQGELMGTYKK